MLQKALEESKKEQVNPDVMSYEELLELGEKIGAVDKGLTNEEIDLIPIISIYSLEDESGEKRMYNLVK